MNEFNGESTAMMMPSNNSTSIKFPNYFGQPSSTIPSTNPNLNNSNKSDELIDLNNLFGKMKIQ